MDKLLKTGTLKRSASRTEIRATDLAAMEITVDQQDDNHEVQRPIDWPIQFYLHSTRLTNPTTPGQNRASKWVSVRNGVEWPIEYLLYVRRSSSKPDSCAKTNQPIEYWTVPNIHQSTPFGLG
ncbi:hypothetical protein AVEN_266440-1 [Araneus ventricosus]|uniref:Uncharacterized protein n=1 Tax=Araneus ventricosus TaxID=182803 RepID=A0A4Y2G5T6_ARAVE|nr:hypothetical protein AVEN_266440-1 [Araneus ventricosus]